MMNRQFVYYWETRGVWKANKDIIYCNLQNSVASRPASTIRSVGYLDFQEPLHELPANGTSVGLEPQKLSTATTQTLNPYTKACHKHKA